MNLFMRLKLMNRARRFASKTEPECVKYLRSLDLRGKTCIDIGANKGGITYWMCHQVGARGKVVAFEPQPELCAMLTDYLPYFPKSDLKIEQLALSVDRGEAFLHRPQDCWPGAGISQSSAQSRTDVDVLPVKLESLDRYVAANKLGPLAFIKCDVEGHEEEVFRGGRQTLQRDKPQLLFEGHHEIVERGTLLPFLESLGYVGFFFAFQQLHSMQYWKDLAGRDNPMMTNYVYVDRAQASQVPVASAAERAKMQRRSTTWNERKAAAA